MNKIKIGLALVASLMIGQLHAVEFADYDFSQFSQEVTECDRLTSHGRDPGHIADPVSQLSMDKPAAIEACLKAVAADPENPRLNYQLGRAYGYSGLGEKAMPYRLKAIEKDYPQSLFVIGYLYMLGQTIDQDICKTMDLWTRGARYQRLAALVSLPRTYMRGGFDSCGVEVPSEDLKAYLLKAQSMTSDYYQGLLIEDLLAELEGKYK